MRYTSLIYYGMVLILVPLYYCLPKRFRWTALLAGSIWFYLQVTDRMRQVFVLLFSVGVSYLAALLLEKLKSSGKDRLRHFVLAAGIGLSTLPLILEKIGSLFSGQLPSSVWESLIVPVGLSFYSLQLAAYLADVSAGKVQAQKNPLKFGLFATFFPQIIQGPIPRYGQLQEELFEGNDYRTENLMGGIQLLIWGFFLKYMIADKAAVIVNTVFSQYHAYSGTCIWLAAILYSFQLYADFLSCTTMSQGVAELFGIHLADNFRRPYFSASVRDFWNRWHISLSSWLRDYIYIPLGGNRRGRYIKWLNLCVTFAVSGLWHGGSWKFLFWGLLHAFYQIMAEILHTAAADRSKGERSESSPLRLALCRIRTFLLILFTWIIFRADSLRAALVMIRTMVTGFAPWQLFDGTLVQLGLNRNEFTVLLLSLLVLYYVSRLQEAGVRIREKFNAQVLPVRWAVYILAILAIWVFGSYGYGFDANDFIYGGF